MANVVRFNIQLNIDGKDRVVVATTAVDNLRHVVNSVNEATEDLRGKLINTNQITEAWENVTNVSRWWVYLIRLQRKAGLLERPWLRLIPWLVRVGRNLLQ